MEELEIRQHQVDEWHKMEYRHGVLMCSCGWKSKRKFRTIASVHKAAKAHVRSVPGTWEKY